MKKRKRIVGLRRVKVAQLRATDGKEMIASASNVFPGGIFDRLKQKGKSKPTKKAKVIIYKITKNYSTQRFAERLGRRKLWQDSQIVAFCRDYPYWVPGTSFLFEAANGTLFVASTGATFAVVIGPYEGVKTWPTVVGRKIAVLE